MLRIDRSEKLKFFLFGPGTLFKCSIKAFGPDPCNPSKGPIVRAQMNQLHVHGIVFQRGQFCP